MSGAANRNVLGQGWAQMIETDQIPFSKELARKATHTAALIIPGIYYLLYLSWIEMLAIMVPAALLMLSIDISRLRHSQFYKRYHGRLIDPLMRSHENAGDFSGASYILISVCLTIALYDKPIAIAALAFIMVGDTFAAIIGRKFGKHKFGRKSIEGSIGCLVGTLLVAFLAPDLRLGVAIVGAVVAAVTEALSTKIDDNISVPLVSGLAMTLTHQIITSF